MIVYVGDPNYGAPETQRYACETFEVEELQDGVCALKLISVSDIDDTPLTRTHDFVIPAVGTFGVE